MGCGLPIGQIVQIELEDAYPSRREFAYVLVTSRPRMDAMRNSPSY